MVVLVLVMVIVVSSNSSICRMSRIIIIVKGDKYQHKQ